jgi:hypothetical protein
MLRVCVCARVFFGGEVEFNNICYLAIVDEREIRRWVLMMGTSSCRGVDSIYSHLPMSIICVCIIAGVGCILLLLLLKLPLCMEKNDNDAPKKYRSTSLHQRILACGIQK